MANPDDQLVAGIERLRSNLEENATRLQAAIEAWRAKEAEYAAVKDELSSATSPTYNQVVETVRKLTTDATALEQLVGNGNRPRTVDQVVQSLNKAIDYYKQNITNGEAELDTAEKKLAAAELLLGPETENEEGDPLMEIVEELDDEDNVVASSVQQTGQGQAELVQALRKTGVIKAEKGAPTEEPSKSTKELAVQKTNGESKEVNAKIPPPTTASEPTSSASPGPSSESASPRKSVSFAEDTKQDVPVRTGAQRLAATGYNEDLASFNFNRGTRVIELDEDENEVASYPIIPQDETPEAAELRRQMLQYGLSEVGQVVAEINLDDPNDDDWDEEMDHDEEYEDDEDDEEEDEYGRSTRPVITEEYRREMLELEKRLNARMMENVGPRPETAALVEHVDDLRTLVIQKDPEDPESMDTAEPEPTQGTSSKKGVRFADKLDVSPAPHPAPEVQPEAPVAKQPLVSTITDIMERPPAASPASPDVPSKPVKVSRFKSARASVTPAMEDSIETVSESRGPSGNPLSNVIVEKPHTAATFTAPDEFDSALLGREVQAEYHKQRNRMIQQQGGFGMTRAEEEDGPLMETVDGKPKKISRFRAAKLKGEGL